MAAKDAIAEFELENQEIRGKNRTTFWLCFPPKPFSAALCFFFPPITTVRRQNWKVEKYKQKKEPALISPSPFYYSSENAASHTLVESGFVFQSSTRGEK